MVKYATWKLHERPLGCNGHYGNSGSNKHWRNGTEPCRKCKDSSAHFRWSKRQEARAAPVSKKEALAEQMLAAMRDARKAGEELVLGCNSKFGESGYHKHRRAGEVPCRKCLDSRSQWYRFRKPPRSERQRYLCGTMRAVWQHRKAKETLDDACRLEQNRYDRERKRRIRGSQIGNNA
jgi:hypothetical protein